jgi:tetratricopeptide (TPR) repeat protein
VVAGRWWWQWEANREEQRTRAILVLAQDGFRESLESGAAEMAGRFCLALHDFWTMSGHWIEQDQWLVRTLQLGDALPLGQRARLLRLAGYVARMKGNYAEATQELEQSLDLSHGIGDVAGIGATLGQLAFLALLQKRFKQAQQQFDESLRLLREINDRANMLTILRFQADLPLIRGNSQATKVLLEQALRSQRAWEIFTT